MKLQKGFCFLLRICNGQRWRVQETAGGITTGLYYNRARYLDPTTGRWTTQDPLGFAAVDANLYRYVGNRATIATDPSGNLAWFVAVPLVMSVGGFTWLTGSTALVSYRTTGSWWDAGTWGACWDGLRLGSQANVNGLASAARSLLTLGVWNEPWEVWAVDQVDRPVYQEGFLAARFGWELLPTAGIGRLTQAPGQMGRWGRWALGWDAGQNAVQAGRGGWDISQHGLTWTNGLQVVGSLLGLGGNYATWRRLPAGGAPNRQTISRNAPTQAFNFRGPSQRHRLNKVDQETVAKDLNTVIEPRVDVAADVAAINRGLARREGDRFIIHGRTYGVHDGTLYPISGPGFHQLDRGAFKALGVFNTFGDTGRAAEIMSRMGLSQEAIEAGRAAWRAGQP
jgi:RHS repeat-associated protein